MDVSVIKQNALKCIVNAIALVLPVESTVNAQDAKTVQRVSKKSSKKLKRNDIDLIILNFSFIFFLNIKIIFKEISESKQNILKIFQNLFRFLC